MSLLLDHGARVVIAHRGNSAFAPENTVEAIRQGLALGADAVEFDVRATRDGHAVVLHDPTLARTAGDPAAVASLSLAEVRSRDAGFGFTAADGATPWRGRGIAVPTVSEVLEVLDDRPFIVEVKVPEASAPLLRVLLHHGARDRCVVGSASARALAPFRDAGFALAATYGQALALYARALLPGGPARLPYQALCIPPVSDEGIPVPVLRFARMGRVAGVATHVWTVDAPAAAARYWAGGVSGIITNDPGAILAAAGRAAVARVAAGVS